MARSLMCAGPLTALLGLLCGGCALPQAFEVTKGEEPRNVDSQVRFRTTYYFRVLDVCENGIDAPIDNTNVFPVKKVSNRRTLKDSIYRFRMTGKASAIFSQVHFESGTLKSYQIEPFGANVAYDDSNNRFYFKSQQETQEDAREAAAIAKFEKYRKMLDTLPPDSSFRAELTALTLEELRSLGRAKSPSTVFRVGQRVDALIQGARKAASQADLAAVAASKALDPKSTAKGEADNEFNKQLDEGVRKAGEVQRSLDDVVQQARPILQKASDLADKRRSDASSAQQVAAGRYARAQADADANPGKSEMAQAAKASEETLLKTRAQLEIATTQARIAREALNQLVGLIVAEATDSPAPVAQSGNGEDCPTGARKRRGFQILGPEGLRTFDQDERLLMAMSSDGKPLISVMQDLSGRILNQKTTPEQQLLPLSRERLRLTETFRTLDQQTSTIAQASSKALADDTATKAIHAVVEAFSPSKGAK